MIQNKRQAPDALLLQIADYVHQRQMFSALAMTTAHQVLLDSLGCLLMAVQVPACKRLLGPLVPGTNVPLGSRVPGTAFELDPIKAAFDIGTAIRWLDYNDTWLAAEWGHPSDNLGGLLAVADFLSRRSSAASELCVKDLFHWMIKAHEIQGILSLNHAFNRVGLDHVLLVKIATTAVTSVMLGLTKDQTVDALSNAWVDGQSLRTYRHAPNTGSRKSWAAGDATSRGVRLAWLVMQGEQGYPSALSAKRWGFSDSIFQGKPLQLSQALGSYVMENILFKVAFPAEFHAQTAVECAIQLHPLVKDRWQSIELIEILTQEPAMRIINKEGPLFNYADRDHCLQYMIAIGLLHGQLTQLDYSDKAASDPRIDALRSKMQVREEAQFSQDYLDPEKRAIPNAIQIIFRDKTKTERVQIDYPLGHRRRRQEAMPYLYEKYRAAVEGNYSKSQAEPLLKFWHSVNSLSEMPIHVFMEHWVK